MGNSASPAGLLSQRVGAPADPWESLKGVESFPVAAASPAAAAPPGGFSGWWQRNIEQNPELAAVGQFGIGVGKDLGDVAKRLTADPNPGLTPKLPPLQGVPPHGFLARVVRSGPRLSSAIQHLNTTPKNAAQALGKESAHLLSYYTPGLGEEEAGVEGLDAVGRLAQRFGLGRKAARLAAAAIRSGVHDALVAGAQGDNIAGAAAGGAVAPVALEGVLAAAHTARPLTRLFEREAAAPLDELGAGELATPREVAQTAIERNIRLTAPEVLGPGVGTKDQAAASTVYGLRQRLATHASQAVSDFRTALAGWLRELAPDGLAERVYGEPISAVDAGRAQQALAQQQAEKAMQSINAHGATLRKLVKGGVVDLTPLRDLGLEMQDETAGARRLLPSLDSKTASKLQAELATVDDLARGAHTDVNTALLLRHRLWKLGHVPSDVLPEEAQVVAQRTLEPLTQALQAAIEPQGDEAMQAWKALNREYAQYASTFGTRGEILHTILGAKSNADLETLWRQVLDGSQAKLAQLKQAGVGIEPSLRAYVRDAMGGARKPDLAAFADALNHRDVPWLQNAFGDAYPDIQALERRGVAQGIAAPNGFEEMERMRSRLRRAVTAGEMDELFGPEGSRTARAMATIANRIAGRFNPSGSGELIEAARAVPTGIGSLWDTLARGRYLSNVLNPESAERLTGVPVLGKGSVDGRLAAALKRAARRLAGSTGGAAAGISARGDSVP